MDTREKRIYLRLSSKSDRQRIAIKKLDSYDKRRYDSMTEYIVQAILAYNEPVMVGEDRLRQILREELGEKKTMQGASGWKQNLQEEKTTEVNPAETDHAVAEAEMEKVPESQDQTDENTKESLQQENEAEPDMDDTAIEFMKELGIM